MWERDREKAKIKKGLKGKKKVVAHEQGIALLPNCLCFFLLDLVRKEEKTVC